MSTDQSDTPERTPQPEAVPDHPGSLPRLFRELFEFAPDAYLVTDAGGVIQRANWTAVDLFGVPGDRLIGQSLQAFLEQSTRADFRAALQRLDDERRLSGWETLLQHADGDGVPVLVNAVVCPGSGETPRVYWLLRDFSDLQQARRALQASEARYRAVVEDQSELICRFRRDGTLTFVNVAFCRYFGQSADELIGRTLFSLLRRQERAALRRRLAGLGPDRPATSFEYCTRHSDGRTGWQHWTVRAIFDDQGRCQEIQAVARCISELRQREQGLQRSQTQLRNLAKHLQSVREEERASIAREVHDALGQDLTALKIGLVGLRSAGTSPDELLDDLLDSVERMLATVQRLCSELRPALLDDLGLKAAIEWQTKKFRERTGIDCRLDLAQDDIVVSEAQGIALFRILQEALTNIVRHAEADQVRVTLRLSDDGFKLRIEDNGRGIPEKQIDDPGSLGLLGMRERAFGLGGELHILRRQGGGTSIEVRLPA
ncbi:MAG: PAS domain S-box protein [Candidatus Competibacterales bacterium]|nr:PAS domain S-box protein [Candidatus Competibacterales bacterium]